MKGFIDSGFLSSYCTINFSQAQVLEKTNLQYIQPQLPPGDCKHPALVCGV
jgi:hypothetical protein